ncbi:MAG: RNA 2',3'-cyclic phosphodiesterase [Candidatus Anstonellaceae archaeon]
MRLFVAIRVPKDALPQIQRVSAPLEGALGVKMTKPENLHITLRFIGEVETQQAEKIAEALNRIEFEPFEVKLFLAGAFPNRHFPRAIWIGGSSQEASQLASKIDSVLSFLKLPQEEFRLHLTVARAPKSAADIDDFLNQPPFCISFPVDAFFLIRSRLTPEGPIYEDIKKYSANKPA